jgi:hypothetical protein
MFASFRFALLLSSYGRNDTFVVSHVCLSCEVNLVKGLRSGHGCGPCSWGRIRLSRLAQMGKKDAKVRMRKLIPEQRKEIATEASKSAARARSTKAKKKQ